MHDMVYTAIIYGHEAKFPEYEITIIISISGMQATIKSDPYVI